VQGPPNEEHANNDPTKKDPVEKEPAEKDPDKAKAILVGKWEGEWEGHFGGYEFHPSGEVTTIEWYLDKHGPNGAPEIKTGGTFRLIGRPEGHPNGIRRAVIPPRRNTLATSKPSMPGNPISHRTTSGPHSWAALTPAGPVWAICT